MLIAVCGLCLRRAHVMPTTHHLILGGYYVHRHLIVDPYLSNGGDCLHLSALLLSSSSHPTPSPLVRNQFSITDMGSRERFGNALTIQTLARYICHITNIPHLVETCTVGMASTTHLALQSSLLPGPDLQGSDLLGIHDNVRCIVYTVCTRVGIKVLKNV